MELGTEKVSKFKGKKFWMKVVIGMVIFGFIYGIGQSSAKEEISKEKVNYDELVSIIEGKEKEVKVVEKKLDSIEKEYNSKETELEKAMEVVNNKQKVEDEIAKLDGSIKGKQDEIAKLDADISKKQGELAAVTGQIKEKGEAPIVLPAGTFTTGKDIPAGRYKAEPNRGSGNFFVNGGMDVNIILGNGGFGEPEYIFSVQDGDEIEITLSVKFTPVQ
jgi:hypothetical protein